MIEIDTKIPDFCLPNQDDIEICSRDLQNRWVVLYFYPKDNSSGCTTEACDFTKENETFEDMNAMILGISPDSTKKHRNFIEKKDIGITLLSDEDKSVAKLFGVWQLKKMCGKEYMGIVRTTFIIDPNGIVKAVWKNVRVKGHISKVLDKLKELSITS
jgi:peroxiredoxin Q/BCP